MNNLTNKNTNTTGGKNMRKEMKEYAKGAACWAIIGATLSFGTVIGSIVAEKVVEGGEKLKSKVSDFLDSQKLTPEEVEEKEVVVEIRRGKNFSEDDESNKDSVEKEEKEEEEA